MNTKELKTQSESKIKEIVQDFVNTSGLDVSYIKVDKPKTTGFIAKEDTKIEIILE